ncbi:DUF4861 domain-containing protein [Chitinophagaceae bacterium MMS25-I14]
MRTFRGHIALFILPLLAVLATSCGKGSKNSFELVNPLDVARPDELIVLSRQELQQKLGLSFDRKFIFLETSDDSIITVQHDDINGDGQWDEIAFLYSFKPKEQAKIFVEVSDKQDTAGVVRRAHVRQRRKAANGSYGPVLERDTMPRFLQANDFSKQPIPFYQTEGPAWENDKVAFRLYLDVRNGKDIFGKTTAAMMMDTVGVEGDIHYHNRAPWGMDILKVGKSLGAGSLAFNVPFNSKDTLLRLGGDSIEINSYERIVDGPVRALFRLHYSKWHFLPGLAAANVTEEIGIWGGQYFYESKVTFNGLPAGTQFVTGIVNIHSREAHTESVQGSKILYTYDVQSENHDGLGLGIVVPESGFGSYGQTSDDSTAPIQHTYTISEKAGNGAAYRFYAGWAPSDKRFADSTAFGAFMKQQAMFYSNPVQVKW